MGKSKLMRVSIDFWNETQKVYKKNGYQISKVNITKQAARMMKQNSRRNPKYIVNYWPISKKKVKIY